MDVNSIKEVVSSLNNIPNSKTNRSSKSSSITGSDDFLDLSINEYNQNKDELSNSLQAFNQGIGISTTIQTGITKEEDRLSNIQNMLNNIDNDSNLYEDNNQIKKDINKELQNFREIAYNTKYEDEKLLTVDDFENSSTIEISTKDDYFIIEKPNTPVIATSILKTIKSSDLNNKDDIKNSIDVVEKGLGSLENIKSKFEELNDNLQTAAKNSIDQQTSLLKEDYNFSSKIEQFSKTDIMSNSGHLAQSQANIYQDQSINLLT